MPMCALQVYWVVKSMYGAPRLAVHCAARAAGGRSLARLVWLGRYPVLLAWKSELNMISEPGFRFAKHPLPMPPTLPSRCMDADGPLACPARRIYHRAYRQPALSPSFLGRGPESHRSVSGY